LADAARRVGFARLLAAGMDAVDGVLTRTGQPLLGAKFQSLHVCGYLRHRGFLEYVASGMQEESYYRSLVLKAVDASTTFVDVGAHIGVYALLTCQRASRVVAFEPDPYNFSALKYNASKSGCRNIDVRMEAVADRSGRQIFRAFRSTFGSSLLPREVDEYRLLEVNTVSLDDALRDVDLANLVVKIDVEGAEPLALAGMGHIISHAHRLTTFFEINPEALEVGGLTAGSFVQALHSTQMDCAWIDEQQGMLVPLHGHVPFGKGNVMCVKGFLG
jgi:FkbM family methyltransferase